MCMCRDAIVAAVALHLGDLNHVGRFIRFLYLEVDFL